MLVLCLTCVGLALVPTNAYWLLMLLRCVQAAGSASTIALSEFATLLPHGGHDVQMDWYGLSWMILVGQVQAWWQISRSHMREGRSLGLWGLDLW